MNSNFFRSRKTVIIAISMAALAAIASAIIIGAILIGKKSGLNGVDGKDGISGKDASVIISDDGELIVNGNPTGVAANREDSEIALIVEGEEFGRVVGGGKFSSGQTVAVKAVPFDGSCFKGWKSADGAVVSLDETYVFVAEKGKTELTAVFEKSLIEVYFKTSVTESYFGGDFQTEINGELCEFKYERDKYGNPYLELKSPAIFGYGDEVTFKILNFIEPSCKYSAYVYELGEASYAGESGGFIKREDVTDDFAYSFKITENRKYYFSFSLEVNIFVEIVPTVTVSSGNPSFGSVSATECTGKGDEVTLTATVKDSETADYIYDFAGWYLNGEQVCESKTYTFKATDNGYDFTAKFIKKYALKIGVSIYDKTPPEGADKSGKTLSENAYIVKYKKVTVAAFDSGGAINAVTFNGNADGGAADTAVKICGYFAAGETIYLSCDIESAHDSCYLTDVDGEKIYKEKFVYGTWQIVEEGKTYSTDFSQGAAAMFTINENDFSTVRINLKLEVIHYGDKIRG